jgi:hypothetical protein
MSDKNIQPIEIYDLTKNVTGLEINTGFILGLERIILFFLTEHFTDKSVIPAMFNKFEQLLTSSNPEEIKLEELEVHMYTLFALQQLLRASAFEQNLVKKSSTTFDESKIKDILQAYMNNDSSKVTKLYEEAKNDLLSQI